MRLVASTPIRLCSRSRYRRVDGSTSRPASSTTPPSVAPMTMPSHFPEPQEVRPTDRLNMLPFSQKLR